MKRFGLFATLLFSLTALGQQDVKIPASPSNAVVIGRNLAWATHGVTGTDNNYIVQQKNAGDYNCLYAYNNDSVAHSMSVAVYGAGDPGAVTYTGNSERWSYVANVNPSSSLFQVAAGSSAAFAIPAVNSERLTFVVTTANTNTTAGADLILVRSAAQNCPSAVYGTFGNSRPPLPFTCDQQTYNNFTYSASNQIVLGPPPAGALGTFICAIDIEGPVGTPAANGFIQLRWGTTNCGSPSSSSLGLETYVTTTDTNTHRSFVGNPRLLNSDTTHPSLCLVANGSSWFPASYIINVSWGFF